MLLQPVRRCHNAHPKVDRAKGGGPKTEDGRHNRISSMAGHEGCTVVVTQNEHVRAVIMGPCDRVCFRDQDSSFMMRFG